MEIRNIPLPVLNRALEIFGLDAKPDTRRAWIALDSAEGRILTKGDFSPFATAMAEFLSRRGPWGAGGEHEDAGDYHVTR